MRSCNMVGFDLALGSVAVLPSAALDLSSVIADGSEEVDDTAGFSTGAWLDDELDVVDLSSANAGAVTAPVTAMTPVRALISISRRRAESG